MLEDEKEKMALHLIEIEKEYERNQDEYWK